ncbi:acetyltransferase [Bacillus sp. FJAT-27225]|uniref:GNAT family N-acetyltransferase n=1 Tax=Bacillus sp. FJAT-27225 TaxID=1743144 RepID=UPI00080C30B6|nr:GNAT family N-acetyltransferase [Bacillus sp. FJAT-27225]OCA90533.1 acetyltransferase [Bacillus sp. FJAT-27225]
MIIRSLEISDAEKFLALNKRVEESGFMLYEPGEKQTTVEQQRKMIERVSAEERTIFFVAEREGELAGFIAAFGGTVRRKSHSAYLVLGVDEKFRGQGVATQLFHRVFDWANEKEITRLELTVIKTNIHAFNLYRKMGFVIEGEKVHSLKINGEYVNEYYMYKLL